MYKGVGVRFVDFISFFKISHENEIIWCEPPEPPLDPPMDSVRLKVGLLVRVFNYIYTLCMRAAKALMCLRSCSKMQ